MLNCDDVRALLALGPADEHEIVQHHIAECAECAAYGRRSRVLDAVLCTELHWQAPADLTARLLQIAVMPVPYAPPRPSRRLVTIVYLVAIVVVAISLAIFLRFIGALALQIGISDVLAELVAIPGRTLQQIVQSLPASRYAIDLLLHIRDQMVWLLLIAILWAGMDRWNFPIFPRQQSM